MFIFKRKQSSSLTGIVSGNSGTAIASVECHGKGQARLHSCEFAPVTDTETDSTLQGRGLDKQPCTALLAIGDYQLLIVDAPEVPPEELRAAIRWRIQDMIDFHVDDAVLDVFDAPPAGPANSKQLYVVVARTDTVKQHIDELENAGVNLDVIDIPELAMRNIASRLPEDEAGLVSLYFSADQCLITITHNATLYLTRNIDIGYRKLQESAASPQTLCNCLALEIQRSTDYYEHYYRQAAVRTIAILPVPVTLYGLADALQQTLGLETRTVSMSDVVNCDEGPCDASAADCLLAVGAALRMEAVTL
jgi:MSHA biogenesis protein MshI